MPSQSSAVKKVIVAISVKFELNSKDGLRRVLFGLEKDTVGEQTLWKINFQLFERDAKSEEFAKLVELDVEVKTELHGKAESVAQKGLTPKQAAHALGPAADDVKAAEEGEVEEDEARETVEATLKK